MQFYTDPAREQDAHALPDAEVFQASENPSDPEYGCLDVGSFYWWLCFPGCQPDGDPNGIQ